MEVSNPNGGSAIMKQDELRLLNAPNRSVVTQQKLGITAFVVGVEVALVWLYFQHTTAAPGSIRHLVYPFVWINVGGWAVYRIRIRRRGIDATRRHLAVAGFATGYALLLLVLSGNIRVTPGGSTASGVGIAWLVPGWGPMLTYGGSTFQLYLVPFQLVGYLSLAYLLYAHVLLATRRAGIGILGVATCVGCATPVLAQMIAILGGTSGALTPLLYGWAYDIGTAVFLIAVGLLLLSYEYTDH